MTTKLTSKITTKTKSRTCTANDDNKDSYKDNNKNKDQDMLKYTFSSHPPPLPTPFISLSHETKLCSWHPFNQSIHKGITDPRVECSYQSNCFIVKLQVDVISNSKWRPCFSPKSSINLQTQSLDQTSVSKSQPNLSITGDPNWPGGGGQGANKQKRHRHTLFRHSTFLVFW